MTNEINYIDFEPQILEKKFWSGNNYESTKVVVERANEWVRENYNFKIINVETLIIPIHPNKKRKRDDHKISSHAGYVYMIEVVRVWYQVV